MRDIIKKIVESDEEIYSVVAKVISVDSKARTCEVEPLNGDPAMADVRLQANESMTDSFVLVPAIGSNVVISFINQTTAYVAMYSTVAELKFKINDKEFRLSKQGVLIKSATSDLKKELDNSLDELSSLFDLLVKPGTFIAGNIPVVMSPQAIASIVQNKTKIALVKQGIKTLLE
jgi:hypothetical protein